MSLCTVPEFFRQLDLPAKVLDHFVRNHEAWVASMGEGTQPLPQPLPDWPAWMSAASMAFLVGVRNNPRAPDLGVAVVKDVGMVVCISPKYEHLILPALRSVMDEMLADKRAQDGDTVDSSPHPC